MTASIVRLRWRVRRGGAAHRPMEERLEREESIARLDAGIARTIELTCGFDSGVIRFSEGSRSSRVFVPNDRATDAVWDLSKESSISR